MSEPVERAYKAYLRFEALGGGLRCKVFADVFPQLPSDDSFEYEVMKEAYHPDEFAKTYLRQEVIDYEMSDPYKAKEYERISAYIKTSLG